MAFKLIALDLDGTLLNSQRTIWPESVRALDQARQKGIQVVIVTGRHHVTTYPYHHLLALDTPAICCNGTYVYDFRTRSALATNPLEKEQVSAILAVARRYDLQCSVYAENAVAFEVETERVRRLRDWAESVALPVRPTIHMVKTFEHFLETETIIWKIEVSHAEQQVLRTATEALSATMALSCDFSWHNMVDIVRLGNSKGGRLIEWARSQGFEPSEVIAFGDNHNDISMLAQAGMGIAMGNSDETVKAAADWVTGDHDSFGIAQALERFVL
ncbi:MAG TPA: pyridoxal phosphatase [Telmatospirillum sp.]|nr:pyridoxal phosphatase [Telmatospirillum sp.]